MAKMRMVFIIIMLHSSFFWGRIGDVFAQNAGVWTLKLEEVNKVFIENKGQFNERNNQAKQPIEYGVRHNGVEMYFTKSGITFAHDTLIPFSDPSFVKTSADKKENSEDEGNEKQFKRQALFLNMTWQSANPNTQIIVEQEVTNYFTYFSDNYKNTIHARAFKKIIYKNIYPDIDVEYFFPKNKEGFKYNIILHPGADPAVIKMKYTGADKMYLDTEGHITIVSAFGNFIDHAPVAYDKKGTAIQASFQLNSNTVSFKLDVQALAPPAGGRVGEGFITIDPWVSSPVYNDVNNAYDIDWDYRGNVYVYGGSYPFQLTKLNNMGVILWTAQPSFIDLYAYDESISYGDFAIDRISENVYLIGWGGRTVKIIKLNIGGNEIASQVFYQLQEAFRIAFNSFTRRGIVGGGGIQLPIQALAFDANLTTFIEADAFSTGEIARDIALLAIDDTNAYMLAAATGINRLNTIVKCNISDLSTAYIVPGGHNFWEIGSVKYFPPTTNGYVPNGFNGMAKSKKYLYTYDGATLKQLNPLNGAFIKSLKIATDSFAFGGIVTGECDENVYLGVGKTVQQYDSSLTFIASFDAPDTVYDVALGAGGNLLACGKGFVSSLTVSAPPSFPSFTINIDIGTSTCTGNDGSAAVNITGGTGSFSYLWDKGGQTTSTITGLNPGKYPVFVFKRDNLKCAIDIIRDTAIVFSSSGFTGQSNNVTVDCHETNSGTATEYALGGVMPYTYLWMPGEQSTMTATDLVAGTYTVTVKDAEGCQMIDEATVKSSIYSNFVGNRNFCVPQVLINGGIPPFTYLWTPGGATDNYIRFEDLLPTSYSVTVTDAQGCSVNRTFFQSSRPWSLSSIGLTGSDTCKGVKGSITIDLINDSTYSFLYDFAQNTGTTYQAIRTSTVGVLPDLNPGSYRCAIHDYHWCKDTIIDFVIKDSSFVSVISITENISLCKGSSAIITASGANAYTWIPPSGLSADIGSTVRASPLISTTYTVTNKNGNCPGDSATITITVISFPITLSSNISIFHGASARLEVSGGTSYLWSTGETDSVITVFPPQTTIYTVIVSDAGGCEIRDSIMVFVNLSCGEMFVPNAFSPNNDKINDVLYVKANCVKQLDFKIYDRWGNKVFEAAGINDGWDGRYQDKPMDPSVFVYYLQATLTTGGILSQKGYIMLIK